MKKRIFLFQIIVVLLNSVYAQENKVIELTNIYKNADYDCYTELIQKDIDDFTSWLVDTLMPAEWKREEEWLSRWEKSLGKKARKKKYQRIKQHWFDNFSIRPRPKYVDLKKENKVFFLSICLRDLDHFQSGDNIYDHIIVDSTRTFIVACLDDSLDIIGISDLDDKGSFESAREWVQFHYAGSTGHFQPDMKTDKLYHKNFFRRLLGMETDALLHFNHATPDEYLYIKDGKIYVYKNDFEDVEFQEYMEARYKILTRSEDLPLFARFYEFVHPQEREGRRGLSDRKTGNTPKSELRICK